VKVSGDLGKISISFDEATLVPSAGLIAPAAFMQRLGLGDLFAERLRLDEHRANCDITALTVIGSVLAGGNSIDDTDLMRAGANEQLLGEVRASSIIGTWLRAWRWHNVRESDAISRKLLARLWAAGAGPADFSAALTIDLNSTIVEVVGRSKQGARYGYTKELGYHPLLATLAQNGQVLASRMRGGNAGARSAAGFLAETISRVLDPGATGQLTMRADSAFYSGSMLNKAKQLNIRFSITVRQDKKIARAIDAIPEADWRQIPY
jgi:hypothetical protein